MTDRDNLQPFYQSQQWKDCRRGYAKSVGYLCEDCLAKGIYTAGRVVHHVIPLTLDNVSDPSVSLAWENLRYLCQDCHAERHARKNRRYTVDSDGNVYVDSPLVKK